MSVSLRTSVGTIIAALGLLAVGCATDDPLSVPSDGSRNFALGGARDDVEISQWSDVAVEATSMDFLPDGRALVTTKGGFGGPGVGLVKLLDTDGSFVWDVGRIPVCSDAERGLLGIAVDPDWTENRFVYVYYTRDMSDCALNQPDSAPVWNRVSRFVLSDDGIDPASETVLVDEIPGHQSSHNSGDLEFLPDGTLAVSTGEAAIPETVHDPSELNGKILRLDLDAPDLVPADNPFVDQPHPAGLVYSTGMRNPFRIAVDANGTIFAGDVGFDTYEEINIIESGADYGWPESEGPDVQPGAVAPTLWYRSVAECANAIIGGDFMDGAPIGVEGEVLVYGDFGCGTIFAAEFAGDTIRRVFELGEIDDSMADIVTGPDGSVHILSVGPGLVPILRMTFD